MLAIEYVKQQPLSVSFKWKGEILHLTENKSHAEVAKVYGKNKYSICKIVKKEKETCASFVVAPQTAKVMVTLHHDHLVKRKKVLNLYNKIFWEREAMLTEFLL